MGLLSMLAGILTTAFLMTVMEELGFYSTAHSFIEKLAISLGIVIASKVVSKIVGGKLK